jgi:hypothetical protein
MDFSTFLFPNIANIYAQKLKIFVKKDNLTSEDIEQINVIIKEWLQLKHLYEPTPLLPKQLRQLKYFKKVILSEFIEYCKMHNYIPRMKELDEKEGLLLDQDKQHAWRILFLRICNKDTDLVKEFPQTMKLINRFQTQKFLIPSIMFSILEPGACLPTHVGYNCMLLRYHLGLIIPSGPDCYLTVDGKNYKWNPEIYFDDTFSHSVTNNTDKYRVVLLLDTVRDLNDEQLNKIARQLLEKCKYSDVVASDIEKANLFHGANGSDSAEPIREESLNPPTTRPDADGLGSETLVGKQE